MFSQPFRGSVAVAGGFVTRAELRGPRFRRLFTGIFVDASVVVNLALRSRAAALVVPGAEATSGGVLGGWSAAELLRASCGSLGAPVEVIVAGGRQRGRAGLVVRCDVLASDEVTSVDGVPVTTPLRTAYDLARRPPIVEAVVAVDALAHAYPFVPRELVTFGYRHLGARGSGQLAEVVRLSDRLAESPMETRIRLALGSGGLPAPVLQHPVGPYRLDLSYPDVLLGIEYDGQEHLTPDRALRDLARQAYLTAAGWEILRFRAFDMLRRPRLG